jgi:hypothetical protein
VTAALTPNTRVTAQVRNPTVDLRTVVCRPMTCPLPL